MINRHAQQYASLEEYDYELHNINLSTIAPEATHKFTVKVDNPSDVTISDIATDISANEGLIYSHEGRFTLEHMTVVTKPIFSGGRQTELNIYVKEEQHEV